MCGREEVRRMKLFRRRISRSAVLLFFNMVLVLVSALLVLVNMQARTELDESKRGFYTDRASYMINEESSWEEIRDILLEDEIKIIIELGNGMYSAVAWGCDLTYDYVKINGDYRT